MKPEELCKDSSFILVTHTCICIHNVLCLKKNAIIQNFFTHSGSASNTITRVLHNEPVLIKQKHIPASSINKQSSVRIATMTYKEGLPLEKPTTRKQGKCMSMKNFGIWITSLRRPVTSCVKTFLVLCCGNHILNSSTHLLVHSIFSCQNCSTCPPKL